MKTITKPMSAPTLVQCLAGELYADPYLIVEMIKEEEEVLTLVRQYGKGLATYEEVRDAVSAIV